MSPIELVIGVIIGLIILLCIIGVISFIFKRINKGYEKELNDYTNIYIRKLSNGDIAIVDTIPNLALKNGITSEKDIFKIKKRGYLRSDE